MRLAAALIGFVLMVAAAGPTAPQAPSAAATEQARANAHANTVAAAKAAHAKLVTLGHAGLDGPSAAYSDALLDYYDAWKAFRDALMAEARFDPAVVKLEAEWDAASEAYSDRRKDPSSTVSDTQGALDRSNAAMTAWSKGLHEAQDRLAQALADGPHGYVLPSPNSRQLWAKGQTTPSLVASDLEDESQGASGPAGDPAPPEADTRVEQPALSPTEPFKPRTPASGVDQLPPVRLPSDFEKRVLDEINRARTQPQDYSRTLGQGPASPAREEAIAFVQAQTPLPPLDLNLQLAGAASKDAADQGPRGLVGHTGSDGSTPAQRMKREGVWSTVYAEEISLGQSTPEGVVRQLVIDEQSASRSHRKDIFDAHLVTAGVGCGPHKVYRSMCVIDMTGRLMSPPPPPPPPPP